MYEKTRYTSKWPESSEVRQSTGTSRPRIERGAGTLYGCYRYRWSAQRLPKGRTLARCSAVESSLDEELSGFVLETLRDGGEFALYRVRQHGRCCGSAVLRAARRVGRRRVGEQVSMNCNPASLPFLAPANCAADPVAGDDLRVSRAAQDGEHLARHSLYLRDFKVADLGLSLYFPRREECCGMRVAKRTRLCVTLLLVAGLATLMLGCRSAGKRESSAAGIRTGYPSCQPN